MAVYSKFYTSQEQWQNIKSIYDSEEAYLVQHYLEKALEAATQASMVSVPGAEVQGPAATVTGAQLMKLEELRSGLAEFCGNVHKGASEFVDEAIFCRMNRILYELYELSPSDIKSRRGDGNLSELVVEISTDEALKLSLQEMLSQVDEDRLDEEARLALIASIESYYEKTYDEYMTAKPGYDTKEFETDMELVIRLYEEIYPEHGEAMDQFFAPMSADTTKDYSADINQVKYIAYTADEPYRSVFMEYVGQVELVEYEYEDRQYHGSGKVWLNFSGKEKGVNDPIGPYTTVFHEMGHAIDDLSKQDGRDEKRSTSNSGKESVQFLAGEDLKKHLHTTIDTYLEQAGYELSEEEIESVIGEIMSGDSNPDNLQSKEAESVYTYVIEAYGWNEIIQKEDGTYDYEDHIGTVYNLNGTENVAASDVVGGLTNNTIGGYGYSHKQKEEEIGTGEYTYWFDTSGNATGAQGKELWAEYFAYQMTGHEEGIKVTEEYFPSACEKIEQEIEKLAK